MRHGMVNRKLGRTSSHRNAMFRNQLASLIGNERIVTTLPKAKELRPLIEKLVTLGKNDSVHARRQAARVVADDALIAKLFGTLGPRFAERPGGYTRIIKLGPRRGDNAEMAILEFVDYERKVEAPEEKGKKKAAAAPKDKDEEASDKEAADDEEPRRKKAAMKAKPAKTQKKAAGRGKAARKPAAKSSGKGK